MVSGRIARRQEQRADSRAGRTDFLRRLQDDDVESQEATVCSVLVRPDARVSPLLPLLFGSGQRDGGADLRPCPLPPCICMRCTDADAHVQCRGWIRGRGAVSSVDREEGGSGLRTRLVSGGTNHGARQLAQANGRARSGVRSQDKSLSVTQKHTSLLVLLLLIFL